MFEIQERKASVIGSFWETALLPCISNVFWYLNSDSSKGFGNPSCRCRIRTMLRSHGMLEVDNVLARNTA